MSINEWFTLQDEAALLSFDQQASGYQQQFRSLYTPVPGFDPPTAATAEAVDLQVGCWLHPKGLASPSIIDLTFVRKIPVGLYMMSNDKNFAKFVGDAITAKIQATELSKYAKEHNLPCAKCSKPCEVFVCKSFWQHNMLQIYICMPLCGGVSYCGIEVQREAERMEKITADAENTANSILQTNDDSLIESVCGLTAAMKMSFTQIEQTCGSCGKRDGDGIQLKTCARCKFVRYCSRECQVAHWKRHKKVCKPPPPA